MIVQLGSFVVGELQITLKTHAQLVITAHLVLNTQLNTHVQLVNTILIKERKPQKIVCNVRQECIVIVLDSTHLEVYVVKAFTVV